MAVTNLLGTGEALDSSLNTIISEFRMLEDEEKVMRSCATEFTLKPHEGVSKRLNNYNRLVAFDVADAADITQTQALADTTTTYTPGEVAVQTWLPGSTMRRAADPDLLKRTGRILRNAYDLKEDQDGGLQFPSFTPIIGAAARVLGPGEYLAAMTRLAYGNSRANPEPPPLPWYIVDHPIKLSTVAGRIIPLSDVPTGTNIYLPGTASRGPTVGPGGGGSLADEIIRKGWRNALGTLFGGIVKPTPNVLPDASDDVSGVAMSQEGFIHVTEVPARIDPDDSDKSYRGAVELNGWGSYAWGLYRSGNYGVEILGDAVEPTS